MKRSIKLFLRNNKSVTLTEKNYKAAGGEGTVYVKDNYAYKIYHDASKMIPEAKIQELSVIRRKNILNPLDVLYNSKSKPVGFIMNYVDKTEYLCKLFVKNFKDNNNISLARVIEIVTEMQKTLVDIHKYNILVVDYNEMNFLIDKKFKTPYHIDVDSWQTKNFKTNVLMETVRDRTTSLGAFNEMTDWFSFAVVTFQLYTGIHPYRGGRHPKYKPKDWSKRMDDGVSVFDKDIALPPFISDFNFIPTKHLEWYKSVFSKNQRTIPPLVDGTFIPSSIIVKISSTDVFNVQIINCYDGIIKRFYYFNHNKYIITNKKIYKNKDEIFEFTLDTKNFNVELVSVFGEKPLIAYIKDDKCNFIDLKRNYIGSILAKDFMYANEAIYTIHNGKLIENTFEKFGKVIHKTKKVCNVYDISYKVFQGVVVQDIVGTCWLAIPYKIGFCANVHIKELDGYRIIDAKYSFGMCMVIAEKGGKYSLFSIMFGKCYNNYTVKEEKDIGYHNINFIRLPNKVGVMVDDEKLILFVDMSGRKEFKNAPLDLSMQLYNENNDVLFSCENKLYSLKVK